LAFLQYYFIEYTQYTYLAASHMNIITNMFGLLLYAQFIL